MSIPSIQNELFPDKEAEKALLEFQAKTYLWEFFLNNHNKMLLDVHLTEIVEAVETYKSMLKTDANL